MFIKGRLTSSNVDAVHHSKVDGLFVFLDENFISMKVYVSLGTKYHQVDLKVVG